MKTSKLKAIWNGITSVFPRSKPAATNAIATDQPPGLPTLRNNGETEIDRSIAKIILEADVFVMEEEIQGGSDGMIGIRGHDGSLDAGVKASRQKIVKRKFRIVRHLHKTDYPP